MNASYRFEVAANWTRGRNGVVTPETGIPSLPFSAPPEFHGETGLWTPEHFLLGAVASCFVSAFGAVAEFSKFEPAALQISVESTVEKIEGGYRFTRILILPVLTVKDTADCERGTRLAPGKSRARLPSDTLTAKRGHPGIAGGSAGRRQQFSNHYIKVILCVFISIAAPL